MSWEERTKEITDKAALLRHIAGDTTGIERVKKVAGLLDIPIIEDRSVLQDFSLPHQKYIFHRPRLGVFKKIQEFALAHELGHCVLDTFYWDYAEDEANFFAYQFTEIKEPMGLKVVLELKANRFFQPLNTIRFWKDRYEYDNNLTLDRAGISVYNDLAPKPLLPIERLQQKKYPILP